VGIHSFSCIVFLRLEWEDRKWHHVQGASSSFWRCCGEVVNEKEGDVGYLLHIKI
jgi:hypothetical protein